MAIEVRRVRTLTDNERRTLFGWGKDIFGANNLNRKMRKRAHLAVGGGLGQEQRVEASIDPGQPEV